MSASAETRPSPVSDHGHGGHHITPISQLLTTFGILMFFMVATILAANVLPAMFPGIDTTVMNLIAMGIAVTKAWLVIAIFMGVRWASKVAKLFAIGGIVWFFTLFITLTDYSSRQIEPVKGWERIAPSSLPRDPSRYEMEK